VTAPSLILGLESVLQRAYIQVLIRPTEEQDLLDAVYAQAEPLPGFGQAPSYTRDPKDDKSDTPAVLGRA
jgi:hypothetical protein